MCIYSLAKGLKCTLQLIEGWMCLIKDPKDQNYNLLISEWPKKLLTQFKKEIY